jgi:hypothetical protein
LNGAQCYPELVKVIRIARTVAAILAVWSVLGLIGLAIPGVDALFLIAPALPLYLLSSIAGNPGTRGALWDSAHGPPFLNDLGIALVYVAPGVVAITVFLFSIGRSPKT